MRVRRLPKLLLLTLLAPVLLASGAAPAAAATVPPGFSDTLVASVTAPTALGFMADGRMLITTQSGQLLVRTAAGTLLPTPALDLSARICANSERGLLGVAADPDPATRAIYLFYTARGTNASCPTSATGNPAGAPTNRVSRFVLSDSGTVDPASETILLDGIYSPAGNHNAGDLAVGKDGYLYVSTGDGGCDYAGNSGCGGSNDASRDRNVLGGKILRVVRTTGAPAPGNPFSGAGTTSCRLAPGAPGTVCQETFAWGLRNPFRMAFDPDAAGTTFYINDVGQGAWEEIDLGTPGADYGWNVREGHCANTGSAASCGGPQPAGMTGPLHDYGRDAGCGSITGGAFVPDGVWSATLDGAYLFADFVCGKIMMLSGGTRSDFAAGLGNAVHLEFGTDGTSQALYYTTYTGGGQIRRISFDRGPTEAYVTKVYRDLLDRAPDPAGLQGWTAALERGTPYGDVANGITYSDEYRSRLIAEAYRTYLERGPDPTGAAGWLAAMRSGATIQRIEAGFVASDEYYGRGGATDAAWVGRLYANVLGRGASDSEVQAWTMALAGGASRYQVAMGFLVSSEHLTNVVDGYYRDLLGRGAEPTGARGWVIAIQGGTRVEAVIAGIVASNEYRSAP
jgi:glucose/arabinose dehydrogenase